MLNTSTCDENIVTSEWKYCDKPGNLKLLWKPFPFIVLCEGAQLKVLLQAGRSMALCQSIGPSHSAVGRHSLSRSSHAGICIRALATQGMSVHSFCLQDRVKLRGGWGMSQKIFRSDNGWPVALMFRRSLVDGWMGRPALEKSSLTISLPKPVVGLILGEQEIGCLTLTVWDTTSLFWDHRGPTLDHKPVFLPSFLMTRALWLWDLCVSGRGWCWGRGGEKTTGHRVTGRPCWTMWSKNLTKQLTGKRKEEKKLRKVYLD